MYNRYVPEDAGYVRVTEEPAGERQERRAGGLLNGLLTGRSQGTKEALGGLLKALCPGGTDLGDVLLLLIVALVVLEEGDDLDLILALGLMALFRSGER